MLIYKYKKCQLGDCFDWCTWNVECAIILAVILEMQLLGVLSLLFSSICSVQLTTKQCHFLLYRFWPKIYTKNIKTIEFNFSIVFWHSMCVNPTYGATICSKNIVTETPYYMLCLVSNESLHFQLEIDKLFLIAWKH
jgi:hypothetical protein